MLLELIDVVEGEKTKEELPKKLKRNFEGFGNIFIPSKGVKGHVGTTSS